MDLFTLIFVTTAAGAVAIPMKRLRPYLLRAAAASQYYTVLLFLLINNNNKLLYSEIVDGNVKMTLGMIWTIILR